MYSESPENCLEGGANPGGGTLGEMLLPPLDPEIAGKMWETKGKRGDRKGKVGEGRRKETKQKNRTRHFLQVFKVFIKCYLALYCCRIISDLIT